MKSVERFDSSPHHTELTGETGSPQIILTSVQIGVEILIDLISNWFAKWLEKMEDKVMSIIITSIFKLMCLVVAVRVCTVTVAYARYYKRTFL